MFPRSGCGRRRASGTAAGAATRAAALIGLVAGLRVAIETQRFLVGIDDNLAAGAVDDDHFAAGHVREEVPRRRRRRGFPRRRREWPCGSSALRPRSRSPARTAWASVAVSPGVRLWARITTGCGQVRQLLAPFAQQMPENPFFQIEDVVGPVGQILVPQVLEHLRIAAEDAARGELGRECRSRISLMISSRSLGSCTICRWAAKIAPYCLPSDFVASCSFSEISSQTTCRAVWKRAISASTASTLTIALRNAEILRSENQRRTADDSRRDRNAALINIVGPGWDGLQGCGRERNRRGKSTGVCDGVVEIRLEQTNQFVEGLGRLVAVRLEDQGVAEFDFRAGSGRAHFPRRPSRSPFGDSHRQPNRRTVSTICEMGRRCSPSRRFTVTVRRQLVSSTMDCWDVGPLTEPVSRSAPAVWCCAAVQDAELRRWRTRSRVRCYRLREADPR